MFKGRYLFKMVQLADNQSILLGLFTLCDCPSPALYPFHTHIVPIFCPFNVPEK